MIKLHEPDITEEDKKAVMDVLDSGWIVQGPVVKKFEEALARYIGVKHVVLTSSCTAAVHATLSVLRKKLVGKKTIVHSDFSYPSVSIAVRNAGFYNKFCDIGRTTYNPSLTDMQWKCRSREVAAMMTTTMFGWPTDPYRAKRVADSEGVFWLEDAAPGLGSKYASVKVGSRPYASFFSFHATKILTTGEGGAVATNDKTLADELRVFINDGRDGDAFVERGFHYRMTDVQAALGLSALKRLDDVIEDRREIAFMYRDLLDPRIRSMSVDSKKYFWNVQRYVVETKVPNGKVVEVMKSRGIECTIGTYSQSAQPAVLGTSPPNSLRASRYTVAIPLHTNLTEDQIHFVADTLNSIVHKHTSFR